MRRRDIIIILVCIGAVILAGINEAPVTLHGTFKIPSSETGGRLNPRPLVVDFNGAGNLALLVVGPADTLTLYPTRGLRQWGDSSHFSTIERLTSTVASSNIVAVAVGALSRVNATDSAVVAVVTDDYRIEVHDSRLKPLWGASVIGDAAAVSVIPAYAAVVISPERIFVADMGTVVVAMPIADAQHIITCFDGATGELRWRRTEKSNFNRATEAEEQFAFDVDKFKFSAGDIETATPPLYAALTTFPNLLRLTMPHSSEHNWRNEIGASHLYSRKTKKKRHTTRRNDGSEKSSQRNIRLRDNLDDAGEHADDWGRKIAQAASARHARRKPRRDSNALVLHLPTHVLVLHYYTGRVLTALDALRRDAVYDDLDNDGTIDEITLNMGGTVQRQFSRHGFEEVARCSATIRRNWPSVEEDPIEIQLCGHSKANLLERLSVPFTVRDSASRAREMGDQSRLHGYAGEHGDNKEEVASTAPLVLHSVPNAMSSPASVKGRNTQSRILFLLSTGEVAMLHGKQIMREASAADHASTQSAGSAGGDAASAFALAQQHKPWIIATPSEFLPSALASAETSADRFGHTGNAMKPFPHMVPYIFHVQSTTLSSDGNGALRPVAGSVGAQHALAVGTEWMTLINAHSGVAMCTAKLEAEPVGPAVVVDFSGDGVADIIVPTTEGLYGYRVRRHAATSSVGMVMAVVLAVFALLVGARVAESGLVQDASAVVAGGVSLGSTFGSDASLSGGGANEVQEHIAARLRSGKRSTD